MAGHAPEPRLLDRLRDAVRVRHMSVRTERAYAGWVRRFVRHHGMRHPQTLGEAEVASYLVALSRQRALSASTVNQARGALLFLYREVLGRPPDWGAGLVRAQRPARLPVVLSRVEVAAVLAGLGGPVRLVADLLYGAGLRLLEALTLRVKDLDPSKLEIRVRDGKGRRDRVTLLQSAVRHRWPGISSGCRFSTPPTSPPGPDSWRCRTG
jgi:site-specific recombinase XerD